MKTIIIKLLLGLSLIVGFSSCSSDSSSTSSSGETTIVFSGYEYKELKSSTTGRVWLDKNLGASEVCSNPDDQACFGDYYQWGRAADGHEKANSTTTPTASATITPGHSSFILSDSEHREWTTTDTEGQERSAKWNICPSGYSVPTLNELIAENINNTQDAFDKLRAPSSGYRDWGTGEFGDINEAGNLWSSTPKTTSLESGILEFYENQGNDAYFARDYGFPVRCIKDVVNDVVEEGTITHNGISYEMVVSPVTQKVWLDRNLGASRSCKSIDDEQCYGDYYQWGRGTDGHEKSNSSTVSEQALNIYNPGSKFIAVSKEYAWDWVQNTSVGNIDSTLLERQDNWSKTDGTSICPANFRVPTLEELKNETINANPPLMDDIAVFNSFLKLPSSNIRDYMNLTGDVYSSVSTETNLWTNSIEGPLGAYRISFSSMIDPYFGSTTFIYGIPVRCIKN